MAKQFAFHIQTDRCVQCHACEVACKSWNGVELGIQWRRVVDFWEGQFPKVTNRTISYGCMHCAQPACARVCPAGAVSKRADDGIVLVDQNKCIGCRSCAAACPFDVPQYGSTGTMQKCTMCLDRLQQGKQPSCVATCPGEALAFGTLDELSASGAQRLPAETGPAFFISGKLAPETFLSRFKSGK